MGDSLITIIAIILAAILMFVFPLMSMSDRSDDISQLTVKTATTEFVDNVRTTGRLSMDNYAAFEQEISATGNSYDIEMEVKVLDENPGKKTTQANYTKYGENTYYSIYDTQVDDLLSKDGKIRMNEGWIFIVKAKNASPTLAQDLDLVGSNDTYTYSAQASATVTTNAGY